MHKKVRILHIFAEFVVNRDDQLSAKSTRSGLDLAKEDKAKNESSSDNNRTKEERKASVSNNRPEPKDNMIWQPKTVKPTKPSPDMLQRSSTTELKDKTKIDEKEATRKLPKSKSNHSCQSQDLKLTNRFKCLEDEDKMLT